mmetsp:Transcript_20104/g.80191  ORF Transcript_20104/g.80191 Transcript_20104/m.80191 type:complete len:284 (+) Transcript_20104:754-1605(+)
MPDGDRLGAAGRVEVEGRLEAELGAAAKARGPRRRRERQVARVLLLAGELVVEVDRRRAAARGAALLGLADDGEGRGRVDLAGRAVDAARVDDDLFGAAVGAREAAEARLGRPAALGARAPLALQGHDDLVGVVRGRDVQQERVVRLAAHAVAARRLLLGRQHVRPVAAVQLDVEDVLLLATAARERLGPQNLLVHLDLARGPQKRRERPEPRQRLRDGCDGHDHLDDLPRRGARRHRDLRRAHRALHRDDAADLGALWDGHGDRLDLHDLGDGDGLLGGHAC